MSVGFLAFATLPSTTHTETGGSQFLDQGPFFPFRHCPEDLAYEFARGIVIAEGQINPAIRTDNLHADLAELPQIDRAFVREFAFGSPNAFATDEGPVRKGPASRVPYMRVTDPSAHSLPGVPFRSRSTGFPIAPFLVIDEACVATTPLATFSGRRMDFWFFGYTRWVPLKTWWVS